jgi:hypothetical protein
MELCPRCGAYWGCDCRLEDLKQPSEPGCHHDWVEAVAVDLDFDVSDRRAKVLVCRLCGLYAVNVGNVENFSP